MHHTPVPPFNHPALDRQYLADVIAYFASSETPATECQILTGEYFWSLDARGNPVMRVALHTQDALGFQVDTKAAALCRYTVSSPGGVKPATVLFNTIHITAVLAACAGIPYLIAPISYGLYEITLPLDKRRWFADRFGGSL